MNYDHRKDLNLFLKYISETYPVNSLVYKGAPVWPIVKNILFFKALDKKSSADSSEFTFRKFNLKAFLKLLKFMFLSRKQVSTIFGTSSHFRHMLNDSLIDKFYQQLINESQKEFYVFDHYNADNNYRKKIDHQGNTIFTFELKMLILLYRSVFFRRKIVPSLQTNLFVSFLQDFNTRFGVNVTVLDVSRQVIYIHLLSRAFKFIMKRHQVKCVYVLCYYLSEMRAMIWAANELGIENYDMQHGSQGSMHEAYNDFSAAPETGYPTLPKYYWCWNDFSAKQINSWAGKTNFHQAFNKGNTWHDYLNSEQSFSNTSGNLIVLMTLQPLDDVLIDDYILEAIRLSPDSVLWYIRLHPRQSLQQNELTRMVVKNNLSHRVNTKEAFELPLPVLLKNATLHLSKFSGSIEEAAECGVISLILDKIGVDTYRTLIEEGRAIEMTDKLAAPIADFITKHIQRT